jgi:hypothetical protein
MFEHKQLATKYAKLPIPTRCPFSPEEAFGEMPKTTDGTPAIPPNWLLTEYDAEGIDKTARFANLV